MVRQPKLASLLFLLFLLSDAINLLHAQDAFIDSLLEIYSNSESTGRVDIALNLSEAYQTKDLHESWSYAREALKLSQQFNYQSGLTNSYKRYGHLFAGSSVNDSSIQYFTKALSVFRQIPDSIQMAETLHNVGMRYWYLSRYDNALKAYEESMNIWHSLGEYERTAASLFNIGLVYRYTQEPDSALSSIEKSMKLREQAGNMAKVAKCLKTMASIIFDKGNYESAIEYMHKAINMEESLGDSSEMIQTYIELGRIDQVKGNVISAMENYSNALVIAKRLPNSDLNQSVCYINIGEIHRVLRDYDGAYENYRKSLEIRKRVNNRDGIAACYLRLGQLKLYEQQFDSAAYYFGLSVKIYSGTRNYNGLGVSKRNLGAFHIEHGVLDSALIYLQESVDILKSRSDEKGTVESEIFMAMALKKKGDIKTAIRILKRAHDWTSKNGINDLARESAGSLALTLAESRLFEEAYFYRTAHKEYNDKLLSEKNIAQFALKEYKLNAEKKEQERKIDQIRVEAELKDRFQSARNTRNMFVFVAVVLLLISVFILRMAILRSRRNERLSQQKVRLNQQNQALQELSEELQSTLEDKDTLMKEVHHRVKNNLQVILSLLNAQLEHLTDEFAISAIRDSQHRIKTMVLIHQNIYQSNEVSVVRSDKYIRDIISSIYSSNRTDIRPELSLDIEDIDIDLNQAIPTGLIINELVTNSFKYAFLNRTNNNQLNVSFRYDPKLNNVRLIVSDNGIGINTTVDNTPKGFGLDLVRGLTSQLNGEIIVESNLEKGTSVEVIFKLAD